MNGDELWNALIEVFEMEGYEDLRALMMLKGWYARDHEFRAWFTEYVTEGCLMELPRADALGDMPWVQVMKRVVPTFMCVEAVDRMVCESTPLAPEHTPQWLEHLLLSMPNGPVPPVLFPNPDMHQELMPPAVALFAYMRTWRQAGLRLAWNLRETVTRFGGARKAAYYVVVPGRDGVGNALATEQEWGVLVWQMMRDYMAQPARKAWLRQGGPREGQAEPEHEGHVPPYALYALLRQPPEGYPGQEVGTVYNPVVTDHRYMLTPGDLVQIMSMLYPKFRAWVRADDKWKPTTTGSRAWAEWRRTLTVPVFLRLVAAYALLHPGNWYRRIGQVQERWIAEVMTLQAGGFQRLMPHLERCEVPNPLSSTGGAWGVAEGTVVGVLELYIRLMILHPHFATNLRAIDAGGAYIYADPPVNAGVQRHPVCEGVMGPQMVGWLVQLLVEVRLYHALLTGEE